MRLILVRHGQTDGNNDERLVGRRDLPLNQHGIRQAQAVARRLQSEHIDAIISSDMLRAKQTAEYIARIHHLTVLTDPRLRERDFGDYENKSLAELETAAKKQGTHPFYYQAPNGESPEQVAARALPVLQELYRQYRGKSVVVAAHGTLIRSLLMVMLKRSLDEFDSLRHKNTGVTVLDIKDNDNNVVHVINDTSHLKDL